MSTEKDYVKFLQDQGNFKNCVVLFHASELNLCLQIRRCESPACGKVVIQEREVLLA